MEYPGSRIVFFPSFPLRKIKCQKIFFLREKLVRQIVSYIYKDMVSDVHKNKIVCMFYPSFIEIRICNRPRKNQSYSSK